MAHTGCCKENPSLKIHIVEDGTTHDVEAKLNSYQYCGKGIKQKSLFQAIYQLILIGHI